ncbi:ribosomal protein S18-alanine N-acetyltransferase [Devosia sp. XJ19-1]|uniref:Ribosomal protein S18-alanine N-acetyltransferase n=1 Tax=Devosia ureilytica TaxID=2952754 RepID=A0A9Q4AMY8_9HYPH|nr:ribosomal protein S18-alanine N-acetyltransferase [Devosia ureilytica]MCP8882992.1 ribosomal protein S18-alanine N-acetyltransferase [Devosia ureilytica]MCP8886640.1 ribosomal protein S18-alanine N-acetyltransferase [Devosia ureilytica]
MMKFWMAPGGLHIEPAETRDAKDMARIHGQSFYRGWPTSDFISFIEDRATPAYIASDARRRIAGFALIRTVADEAELLTIAVEPRWRGKGVGRALMDAVFADLMLSPARRMFLEVDEQNLAAIRLYEKLGFSRISSRQGYYARPDGSAATALVMARDLG